ncbi:amidohydrolase [Paractinoplanes durhamensis]|uniref:Amidohydrolase n=1 Tax=Paractinoplanes durhamensis TaxID=113563 RepID=A0ABQ3YZQ5_9ACTN|nr:amidohydrolase [Actinoplanes durhamensis]
MYVNGLAWNGQRARPADVHVAGGVIEAVTTPGALPAAKGSEIHDLDGGALLPGFGDAHAHPLIGGLEDRYAPIRGSRTVAEVRDRVRAYARAHPDQRLIYGEGFELTLAPGGVFRAAWLDEVVADRPVVLRSSDIHTVWCNTAALRRAGLLHLADDPVDGRLDRDPDGTPCGTLREWGAFQPALDLVPAPGPADKTLALRRASRRLAAAGVTWVQDAWVEAADVPAYVDAARTGGLSTRMNLALRADPHTWREQQEHFRSLRHDTLSDGVSVRTVKFFADGIVEGGTAALLDPYLDADCCGLLNWEPAELAAAVTAFDADGFQVHIHAMGDAGVRTALDAVEAATRANGPRDRRPVLTHLQLVDPADLPRFSELNVIAVFQPHWARPDAVMTDLTLPRLGDERGDRRYAIADMLATGATVAFASDWPITRPEPLHILSTAATRGGWLPDQRVGVARGVRCYTSGTAHLAFEERTQGSIRPGMRADLVHLGADPTGIDPAALPAVPVRGTWLAGRRTA